MKLHHLLACCLLASASPTAFAAPDETPAVKPAEAATPDELLEKIDDALNAEPPEDSKLTEKEEKEFIKHKLDEAEKLIAEFRKLYPNDPSRWAVLIMEAGLVAAREELGLPQAKDSKPVAEIYAQIIAAKDAPKELREKASSTRLLLLASAVFDKNMPLAEWEKLLAEHLASFPECEDNKDLISSHVDMVTLKEADRLLALLDSLTKNPDPAVVEMAKARIESEIAKTELKAKPLELKFTSVDDSEVDVEKLQGKVVLIDFWATWCGPCMEEMPKVLKVYEKLHDKGLEVIGISLDEEKADLKKIIKKKNIPWPQYFDGKGWDNALAKKYGIDSIPRMWLINKKGMVVDLNAMNGLEEKIGKLLVE